MNSNLASTSNSQPELPRFITNPHNNDTRSVDELARDKAGEDNDVEEDEQQTSGDEHNAGDLSEGRGGDNEEICYRIVDFLNSNLSYRGFVVQTYIDVKFELKDGYSMTLLKRSDLSQDSTLSDPLKVVCNSKLAVTFSVMNECFVPVMDERSGVNVIYNVVYNCGLRSHDYNVPSFFTYEWNTSTENERLKPRFSPNTRALAKPSKAINATPNFSQNALSSCARAATDLILASPVSVDDVALAAVKDDDCFGVFTIDQIKEAASGAIQRFTVKACVLRIKTHDAIMFKQDQRELFLAIANVLKEHKSTPKETLKFLTKYLATFSGEDANVMEEAKEEAVYTIIEFCQIHPRQVQVSYYLTRLDHEVVIQFVKTLF
ncbi:hypothetical protein Tco_1530356 [Tanacetum coccineum]